MSSQSATRSSRPGRAPGLARAGIHALVVALCLITIFPMVWMLSTAFKGSTEIFTKDIRFLPRHVIWSNFPDAFTYFPTGHWLLNSISIAFFTTLGKVVLSVPAAFAFARIRFRFGGLLFAIVLATMVVPGVVTIVPNFVMISKLNWLNTQQGVIVPSLANSAFSIFLLRQTMRALPQEILDAARVDGAGHWRALFGIVIPNVRSGIAVVATLAFLGSWNQYLWPLLVLSDLKQKTLAVGMQFFATTSDSSAQLWGPMMATATIAILPPLIVYAIAQKQIIESFVSSGVKG